MSRHTISHADDIRAGFHSLPVDFPIRETIDAPGPADTNSIADDVALVAGVPAVLNGALVQPDGTAVLIGSRNLNALTPNAPGDNGLVLTVRGRDPVGRTQHETLTFTGGAAVQGVKAFSVIDSITPSRDSTSTIDVGNGALVFMKARSAKGDWHMSTEDGVVVFGGFIGGTETEPTPTSAAEQARYQPVDPNALVEIMYVPDRRARGLGKNYVTPGEAGITVP